MVRRPVVLVRSPHPAINTMTLVLSLRQIYHGRPAPLEEGLKDLSGSTTTPWAISLRRNHRRCTKTVSALSIDTTRSAGGSLLRAPPFPIQPRNCCIGFRTTPLVRQTALWGKPT